MNFLLKTSDVGFFRKELKQEHNIVMGSHIESKNFSSESGSAEISMICMFNQVFKYCTDIINILESECVGHDYHRLNFIQ